MRRRQIPLFALLGLMWALILRAIFQNWISEILPSWSAWLLAGTLAGCLALIAARPTRGWNWLWRPLVVGLGYAVSGLILLPAFWLLSESLSSYVTHPVGPHATSRTVPLVVASVSRSTETDAQFILQIVSAPFIVALIGASFCGLAGRRHSPGRGVKVMKHCSGE